MLKLNEEKTELLVIHPRSSDMNSLPDYITGEKTCIWPSLLARNLAIDFDSTKPLERHEENVRRVEFRHLHSSWLHLPVP